MAGQAADARLEQLAKEFRLFKVLLHHTETVDPELVAWIRHLIEDVIGVGPWLLVIVIGAVLVAIPLWVIFSVVSRRLY